MKFLKGFLSAEVNSPDLLSVLYFKVTRRQTRFFITQYSFFRFIKKLVFHFFFCFIGYLGLLHASTKLLSPASPSIPVQLHHLIVLTRRHLKYLSSSYILTTAGEVFPKRYTRKISIFVLTIMSNEDPTRDFQILSNWFSIC